LIKSWRNLSCSILIPTVNPNWSNQELLGYKSVQRTLGQPRDPGRKPLTGDATHATEQGNLRRAGKASFTEEHEQSRSQGRSTSSHMSMSGGRPNQQTVSWLKKKHCWLTINRAVSTIRLIRHCPLFYSFLYSRIRFRAPHATRPAGQPASFEPSCQSVLSLFFCAFWS
jgi:hypothetical protein